MQNKFFVVLIVFLSGQFFAQKNSYEYWKKLTNEHSYNRSKNYQGPNRAIDNFSEPLDEANPNNWENEMDDTEGESLEENTQDNQKNSYNDSKVDYTPETKERKQNATNGDGSSKKDNETFKKEKPEEFQDFEKESEPIREPWKFDLSKFSGFFNFLFWVLIIGGGGFLVFLVAKYFIQNRGSKVVQAANEVEDDTPVTVSKTELERRLEEAELTGNYRECVRIYFTFILKELMHSGTIIWKKDKTNREYKSEMNEHQFGGGMFGRMVYIFDFVWYGKIYINEAIYNQIKPEMISYYAKITGKQA